MTATKTATKTVSDLTVAKLYKADTIDKRIEALHKAGHKLQTEAHKLACSVLLILGTTKDVRPVLKFINAMPDMARINGLRNWFEQFGPVKFITDPDTKVERAVFVKDKATKVGDAIAKPFWKFSAKEGTPYEPIDVAVKLNAFIKSLEKDAMNTKRDHSAIIAALKGVSMPTASLQAPTGDVLVDSLTK